MTHMFLIDIKPIKGANFTLDGEPISFGFYKDRLAKVEVLLWTCLAKSKDETSGNCQIKNLI